MTLPIAHAGHWLLGLSYFAPVIFFLIWLAVAQIRDRRRGNDDPESGVDRR